MEFLIECDENSDSDSLSFHLLDFYRFACDRLDIQEHPSLTFIDETGGTSFGSYHPSDESVTVATQGRHISDILRTFGHELVHHKQLSEGPNPMTIEELEYEANAVAGMLMRDYNKLHPEMFGLAIATPEQDPSVLGDSQGAVAPDTTRPSGPINMGEEMTAGSGAVAGIGIGPQGEPGVYNTRYNKKRDPRMFGMFKRKAQISARRIKERNR
jgi:hypothetical protein